MGRRDADRRWACGDRADATAEGPQRSSLAALIAVETAVVAVGVGLVRISTRHDVERRSEALPLATTAGVLFGVSEVAIKYLTRADGPLFGLLSPWTLTALISLVFSFDASARSFQIGFAIQAIAIISVAASLSEILGGILMLRRADRLRRRRDHRPSARVRARDRERAARSLAAAAAPPSTTASSNGITGRPGRLHQARSPAVVGERQLLCRRLRQPGGGFPVVVPAPRRRIDIASP